MAKVYVLDEESFAERAWDLPFVATVDDLRKVVGGFRLATALEMAKWMAGPRAINMPDMLRAEVLDWLGQQSKKSVVLGKAARQWKLKEEPYDPDARDGDGDGIVQEGTAWERPAGTRFVRANGREISAGLMMASRPTSAKLVDADGNEVDYTPTYDRPGFVPMGDTIGEIAGNVVKPRLSQRKSPLDFPIRAATDDDEKSLAVTEDEFESLMTEWIDRGDDSWMTVRLAVRELDEEFESSDVRMTIDRRPATIEERAKMVVARRIANGWAERGLNAAANADPEDMLLMERETKRLIIMSLNELRDRLRFGGSLRVLSDHYLVISRSNPEFDQLYNEAAASRLVGDWAGNDTDSLENVLKDFFGGTYWKRSYAGSQSNWPGEQFYKAFIQIMYEDTQRMFAEAGITEVVLFRGMTLDYRTQLGEDLVDLLIELYESASEEQREEWNDPDGPLIMLEPLIRDVLLRPANAFSTSKRIANEFIEQDPGEGRPGIGLTAVVPVRRILATPATGIGCFDEFECVVFGGETTQFKVDAFVEGWSSVMERLAARIKKARGQTKEADARWN